MQLPELIIEVTEFPDVTIPSESFGGGWEVSKYGPFVHYVGPAGSTAGDFNIRFRSRFAPVVDIELSVAGRIDPRGKRFSLPLTRARQLVRKYDSTWRLLVSDKAAESGTLLWLPVETMPGCRGLWSDGRVCLSRPTRKINTSGIDLPLCALHVKEHNDKYAIARQSKAS